jgi:hypothetical protein
MQSSEEIKQQMFAHIEQWKQADLSQKAYCEQHNLFYHVFHYWYKRYRDNQSMKPASTFVELQVQQSTMQPAVELLLPDGKRFLFHQPVSSDYLKALIS